jgi:DNA uptake protein ComE-like DNA-binding protein
VTYGATAGNSVTRDLTKLSAFGQEGSEEFVAALKQSRAALATLTTQMARNPQRLGSAVGPELWLGMKRKDETTTINLNTAEKTSLVNLLDFEPLDADLLLADRDAKGPFLDVADFAKRRNLSPLLRKRFEEAAKLAISLGGYQRP